MLPVAVPSGPVIVNKACVESISAEFANEVWIGALTGGVRTVATVSRESLTLQFCRKTFGSGHTETDGPVWAVPVFVGKSISDRSSNSGYAASGLLCECCIQWKTLESYWLVS